MPAMPKVSVIIPVYNVEQYIERCARSLFEQTLDDIEYIFVNCNGICAASTGKEKIVQQMANSDTVINHIFRYGGKKMFREELMHRKCSVKMSLWKLPWREYLSVYPETNLYLFFDSNIPLAKKMGHLTKCFGIHGISKLFSHRSKG